MGAVDEKLCSERHETIKNNQAKSIMSLTPLKSGSTLLKIHWLNSAVSSR